MSAEENDPGQQSLLSLVITCGLGAAVLFLVVGPLVLSGDGTEAPRKSKVERRLDRTTEKLARTEGRLERGGKADDANLPAPVLDGPGWPVTKETLERLFGRPLPPPDLEKLVPERIGAFQATAPYDLTRSRVGTGLLVRGLRNYARGGAEGAEPEATARFSISDTATMLSARAAFSKEPEFMDGTRVTKETLRGWPTWLIWRKEAKESRARALVFGRFVLDVQVRPATGPRQALTLLESLDLATMAEIATAHERSREARSAAREQRLQRRADKQRAKAEKLATRKAEKEIGKKARAKTEPTE